MPSSEIAQNVSKITTRYLLKISNISTLTSLSLHMLCSKTQLNNVDNNNVSVIKLSYASFYI